MSAASIQKHLPCHDYHMGDCPLPKQKCPFSHVGQSWGICPNKNYCPTPHKYVDCPLFQSNSCPRGDFCSYRHSTKANSLENKEESNKQSSESSDELNKSSTNQGSSEQKEIVKGLTVEDFKASLVELNQDLKILMPFIEKEKNQAQNLNPSASLDLCFIIDITGSMSPWLTQVVQYVGSTLNTIYSDFPAIDLRVAFSGFRDYRDAERFVKYDFTRNIEEFRAKIATVRCIGGDDIPEDVVGGLFNSLSFSWGSAARQVVFIGDAPAHGLKYHNNLADNHPNGDPDGRVLEVLMQEFSQKSIDFTVIEINNYTKKMFSIMNQSYGKSLIVKDMKQSSVVQGPASLAGVVHEQIKSTVTASLSKSGLSNGVPNQAMGKLSQAFQMIMENKRFRNNLSWSRSKDKSKMNAMQTQINVEEEKVLEEEEYDSDDSEYEQKLNETTQRQYKQAIADKQTRLKKEQEDKLTKLKSEFPSHYFDTVQEHREKNTKKQKIKAPKVQYLTQAINWDQFTSFDEYQAICYSFELIKNYKGGQEINWKNLEVKTFYLGTKVRISNLVFSEGAMRFAYHAKDLYLKQRMVAKQYKKQGKMTIEEMKKDIMSQIVCKSIVKEFNTKLIESHTKLKEIQLKAKQEKESTNKKEEESIEEEKESKEAEEYSKEVDLINKELINVDENVNILQFIDCYIYETTFPFNMNNCYYFEKFIDGKYEKFNNNAGYVNKSDNEYCSLAQSLSHFSWQFTKGYLAIVDLQGNDTGILTDPQIHCLNKETFGDGNLGYQGILRFFSTHECNKYCRMLSLIHPLETSYIPVTNKFFFDYNSLANSNKEAVLREDNDTLIPQLCDICQHQRMFTLQQSCNSRNNQNRLVCKSCLLSIQNTLFTKKCASCRDSISFSTYECIQLRRDAPPLCTQCSHKI